jgi:hypothetical protein
MDLSDLGYAGELRRARAIELLNADPSRHLAVVCYGKGDPVHVTFAIRGKGSGEVLIPAARYDPWRLLDLVRAHGGSALRERG